MNGTVTNNINITVTEAKSKINNYLTFTSETSNEFTISVYDSTKHWDGTLYYSTDTVNWNVWDGTAISSKNKNLYIGGLNNTKITGKDDSAYRWIISNSSKVACYGNIESLLNHEKVAKGEHPVMAQRCYTSMFRNCTSLTRAPELPATTLTNYCYAGMFWGCSKLTQAPELPAITLANYCYQSMFFYCDSLTQASELPATTLIYNCYYSMFAGCTSLTQTPKLPATTLANYCYSDMFNGCTKLTNIHLAKSVKGNSYITNFPGTNCPATVYYDL